MTNWKDTIFETLYREPSRNGLTKPKAVRGNGVRMVNMGELFAYDRIRSQYMELVPLSHSERERFLLREGDLLFARASLKLDGSGKCSIVYPSDHDRTFESHIIRVRLDQKKSDPTFYYYLFCSNLGRGLMMSITEQVSAAGIRSSDLAKLKVPCPPVQEQKRIAGILAALDDKIELNRRMNETLEGMARAIFQSWFVDFDPVIDNALATGHAIPAELEEKAARRKQQKKNHPLPKVIQKLFPDAFEPSAMGPIPKGWNTGCFGDIASNLKRPVKAGEADAHTAYIGLEHMPRQSIALDSWGTASEVESNKFAFNAGEILFGKLRPYFHKVGVPVTSGICSTDILVIAPKADDFFGLALSHASSTALIEFTTASSSGTRMPRTNWSDMSKYKIVLPSSKVVSHLNTIVAGHVSKIKNAIFESRALTHLRDTLLPKLLSGEIEV